MKKIKLSQGKFALVDDEDFENLNKYKWFANFRHTSYYAGRHPKGNNRKLIIMHRDILNPPAHLLVDHIDGNGLNNQKSNLRIVTCRVNLQNRHHKKTSRYSSHFVGVYNDVAVYRKKPWTARIRINNKSKFLGYFLTEEEAHQAYLNAVKEMVSLET